MAWSVKMNDHPNGVRLITHMVNLDFTIESIKDESMDSEVPWVEDVSVSSNSEYLSRSPLPFSSALFVGQRVSLIEPEWGMWQYDLGPQTSQTHCCFLTIFSKNTIERMIEKLGGWQVTFLRCVLQIHGKAINGKEVNYNIYPVQDSCNTSLWYHLNESVIRYFHISNSDPQNWSETGPDQVLGKIKLLLASCRPIEKKKANWAAGLSTTI